MIIVLNFNILKSKSSFQNFQINTYSNIVTGRCLCIEDLYIYMKNYYKSFMNVIEPKTYVCTFVHKNINNSLTVLNVVFNNTPLNIRCLFYFNRFRFKNNKMISVRKITAITDHYSADRPLLIYQYLYKSSK